MRPFPRPVDLVVLISSILGLLACPPSTNDSTNSQRSNAAGSAPSSVAPEPSAEAASVEPTIRITRENILENERYWPNIAALTRAWTPPNAKEPLIKGYRGALIRADDQGRVRLAFGRHGNHDIPIEFTDLIARANQVESGALHKVAPNFIAHFGTQFIHPATEDMLPFPTPELAKSERFLCIFANPRETGFDALARQLATLEDQAGLQTLLFPLAANVEDLESIKKRLQDLPWLIPFAYPQAAETHARSLLGEIPTAAEALLVTSEGRLLQRAVLSDPGALDALRTAAAPSP